MQVMAERFPLLFSSFPLGRRTAKNRIVITAHYPSFDSGGIISDRTIEYWTRKAKGGAGTIICHGSGLIDPQGGVVEGRISLWDPRNEPQLARMADEAHEHGALLISQSTHRGRSAGHRVLGYSDPPQAAPSEVPTLIGEYPRVLTKDEIRGLIASWADCARRLDRCGFDGIEVTSLGDMLLQQFWSPVANRRTDEYGGDFDGRLRFSVELLTAIREAVSDDFVISLRMSGDLSHHSADLSPDDLLDIAKRLDSLKAIDLFNITGGSQSRFDTVPPDTRERGLYLPLGRRFKEHLSAPVVVAGRIFDVDQAEQALADGDCDLVAMVRATIADPDLPKKAQAGELDLIRPCIGIVDSCIGRTHQNVGGSDFPIRCAVNSSVGYAPNDVAPPAEQARNVVVVGGGPGGMEAARVAATRGHTVTLYEAEDRLGGQILAATKSPYRPHLGRHVAWLERELKRLDVDVRLECRYDTTTDHDGADAIIVAAGATTILPEQVDPSTAGFRLGTDIDVLEDRIDIEPGTSVVIYDREARIRGGMLATIAGERGASVTLVTPWKAPLDDLDGVQQPFFLRRLARDGTRVLVNKDLVGTNGDSLILYDVWAETEERVTPDLAIFIGFRSARRELTEELANGSADLGIHAIGDCVAPRRYRDAVREGAQIANAL
jgi:2,4-dienoyl-CoA reductase-like NADH-dependent reductase (Old Yellow Enzyme family)